MTAVDHTQELDPSQWEAGVDDLLNCLNPWLETAWNTRLVAGAGEPFYAPANAESECHKILFAHGYFNSALHELAHWCLAGEKRRQLEDYGYWYCPDGRNAEQQAAFEQVEVKPQAIEWWLTRACDRPFRTSLDNLSGEATDSRPFRTCVQQQALTYADNGLPPRAAHAVNLLATRFRLNRPTRDEFANRLPD